MALDATICQLCQKLEAHPFSLDQDSENYLWSKPIDENEPINKHPLCQCCVSLCIAKNYDFESGFFNDKCPFCADNPKCPVRVDPWKICVINFLEKEEKERLVSLANSQLKIIVLEFGEMFLGLLPIVFRLKTETDFQIRLPQENINKELFFGIICKEAVYFKTQSKALFGDKRLGISQKYQNIQGFYNATIIIFDPATDRPFSYALPAKPEFIEENKLFEHSVDYFAQGINCKKTTYFLANPIG